MRLHVIQHVEFEGPALIAEWAAIHGHELTAGLALTEEFPASSGVDFLVVMGGPMDADDEIGSPWLSAEKRYIRECIASGKAVLGVCLGAQILAEVLGGKVRRNAHKEIGWHEVEKSAAGTRAPLIAAWPERFVTGQWHADTFDLPDGLPTLLSSEASVNQAFAFEDRVVGLQFHLEWTEESLEALLTACGDELATPGPWTTSRRDFEAAAPARVAAGRTLLFALLDAMAAGIAQRSAERPE